MGQCCHWMDIWIFAVEHTGLYKSNTSCQHVLPSCIQYWKQCNPDSTVPQSLQCEFSTDFYASATTLFPIPKTAPSKLIPVSVWSPLLWWLSLRGQLNKSPTVSFHWRNSFSQIWIVYPWSILLFMDGLKINRIQRLSDFRHVSLSHPAAIGVRWTCNFSFEGRTSFHVLVNLPFSFMPIIT